MIVMYLSTKFILTTKDISAYKNKATPNKGVVSLVSLCRTTFFYPNVCVIALARLYCFIVDPADLMHLLKFVLDLKIPLLGSISAAHSPKLSDLLPH